MDDHATLTNLLQVGIASVTGALCFVCRLLWNKSELCEQDRISLREEMDELREQHGLARGELTARGNCPVRTCPFRPAHGILIFALLALCSCTSNQVYMERPDGSVRLAWNGGSLGSKAASDTATLAFGSVSMSRTVIQKDEVESIQSLANLALLKVGIKAATDTTNNAINAIPK